MSSKNTLFNTIEFVAGAPNKELFPKKNFLPEFAFIGRSNVGKSSLLNSITNQKKLARVSNAPGRTRQANFFEAKDKLFLVDLPGYGYAKVSKAESKSWNKLFIDYLSCRPNIKIIFLLIDLRRGIMPIDIQVINLLEEYNIPYFLIGTKQDKLSKTEFTQSLETIKQELGEDVIDSLICTSASKNVGIKELQKFIMDSIKN